MANLVRKIQKKQSIRPQLKSMKQNDTLTFPINRVTVVRASAYSLSVEIGVAYSVTIDKEKGACVVKRK